MFLTDFDISDPLNWLLVSLVTMLPALQIWTILKNQTLNTVRRGTKLALNLFLWTVTLAFLIHPYWRLGTSPKSVLVPGNGVPGDWATHLRDSLGIKEIRTQEDFEEETSDTVLLLGQDFEPGFLSNLIRSGQHNLKWVSYSLPDQLQEISWDAILRKGQVQRVYGAMESSREQLLRLRYAGNNLDSISLKKGFNRFEMKFPVFVQGNVTTTLTLGEAVLDTIRFFSRPAQARTYQFVLDSPDFETRTLANWLGKNGHSVLIFSKLSKNIASSKAINKAGEPDVFITDPANSTHPIIRKALANGKSILLMGLSDVEKDFVIVNRALGSDLNVTRASSDENITVSEGLTAWPYKFVSSARTFNLPDIPVAVTKAKGRIGVSLLNETFPMMLSGDSLGYSKVWTSIFARIAPPDSANVSIRAPIFEGQDTRVSFNNSMAKGSLVSFQNTGNHNNVDTLFTQLFLLNEKTTYARFLPMGNGKWNDLDGACSEAGFYTETDKSFASVRQTRFIKNLISFQKDIQLSESIKADKTFRLPGYAWFFLFLTGLTALWVEAKFSWFA